jgi:putative spermidine/putrescine transport system substrate-binding protein
MKFWPTLTPILALLVVAAAAAAKPAAAKQLGTPPPAAQAVPPFQVALPPAAPADVLRRALLKPYTAITGATLTNVPWDGAGLDALKPTPPAAAPDLVLVNSAQVQAGCKSQQFNKLDWARLNRDRFLPGAATDCGAGAYVVAGLLAWDRDKLDITPTWQDFWDIDRAFRKLDQLKPYLTWWDLPSQPAQMLGAGKVLLTSAPSAQVQLAAAAAHRHFGVQWSGALLQISYWVVPHDAPHPGQSALALLIATDPARLAGLAQEAALGPATHDALDLLHDAARAATPSANLGAGLALDEGFWAENGAKLEQHFTAWLAK